MRTLAQYVRIRMRSKGIRILRRGGGLTSAARNLVQLAGLASQQAVRTTDFESSLNQVKSKKYVLQDGIEKRGPADASSAVNHWLRIGRDCLGYELPHEGNRTSTSTCKIENALLSRSLGKRVLLVVWFSVQL